MRKSTFLRASMAAVLLLLAGMASSPQAAEKAAGPKSRHGTDSGMEIARALSADLRAHPHSTPHKSQSGLEIAQEESCPAPQPNEGYCGFYDGQCWYCSAQTGPFFCPGSHSCYTAQSGAEQDCGQGFTVCSSPQ
jgi:hypothetical protein